MTDTALDASTVTTPPTMQPTVLPVREYIALEGAARQWRGGLSRRGWLALIGIALAWSLWDAGVGRQEVLNPRGWTLAARFFGAAAHPELSTDFLGQTWRAAVVTVAYASLGTALSVVFGFVGALLSARATWRRRFAVQSGAAPRHWTSWITRSAFALPRGIHEAVWALFLINVLGRDPLVGVLAIAIPYGAITAKVFAELIDESAAGPHRALRAAGAGRVSALLYGVLPSTLRDLVSYGFYRFECSLRSAVVLGMIGVGGLGFQLALSFQGGQYGEMWTIIYALLALSLAAECWSALVRRRPSPSIVRGSVVVMLTLTAVSAWYVHLRPWTLWSQRARDLFGQIAAQAWPPRLPIGGWRALLDAATETFQMSLLAIAVATVLAAPAAILGARGSLGTGIAARIVALLARVLALFGRALPPTLWSLLVLFVVFPGPLPGALALGIYTSGVLTRLFAEVLENQDQRTGRGLRHAGASPLQAFAYGRLPDAGPRWAAYSLYRWEVAARETVIVGMVGAGGLGRLLSKQTTAFNYQGMLSTVAALIVLTIVVDAIGASLRAALARS